jgi:DNA-binding response OmpR family regulator
MNVLVIEDDNKTADFVVKGLEESGFTVDRAGQRRGRRASRDHAARTTSWWSTG